MELDGLDEAVLAAEEEPPDEELEIKSAPSTVRGRGGREVAAARHQRVPPPDAEPRMPFTTRVTLSTKERLEDACYHLRRKHQDFINEAILAHLTKHGF